MKEQIEKLILNLSNRWECSPQETVDRLNHMNESEINKLVNSMTKKFNNGGFIDCLRNGGTVEKCKCGCDKITKHQQTSVIGNKMPRRTDGPGRVGLEEIKEDGTKVSYLTRPGREGSTWYTEQRISPQGDTTYTAWNTATSPMDRLNSTVYVTPTAYKNMSKFRQRFNEVVPKGWMDAFKVNGLREGGEIKACGGQLPKKSKFKK